MNLSDELIAGSLRIGVGKFTTENEIETASELLVNAIEQILELIAKSKI